MNETLDQVIVRVLTNANEPLSVREISDLISKNKLWTRPKDGQIPKPEQISARVSNYPQYFERKNGKVHLVEGEESDDRLCKIVWNSNFWVKPMERSWNPNYEENPNIGYEQKNGFVGEDWLFNSKFSVDGYQYGYIRGFAKLNQAKKKIGTVYLFTINPNTKERFYVGKLFNAENISVEKTGSKIQKIFQKLHPEMLEELKEVGANYRVFKKSPFYPNVRFRIDDISLFQEPILIESSWFADKYYRTIPVKMTDELYSLLKNLETKSKFYFTPSTPDNKIGTYNKHTKEGATQVEKIHNEIERQLYKFLISEGILKSNIACDTTSFGGKLADVVVRIDNDTFNIYEIKTDIDTRRGLREATGQLLDYATWEKSISIKKIYAVLPYCSLSNDMIHYIDRLKKSITLDLNVLLYDKETKSFIST